MVNDESSTRIIVLFLIGGITLPLIIATTVGVVFINQTSIQINDVASVELFSTGQIELNSFVTSESEYLQGFFQGYETELFTIRHYLENIIQYPIVDPRWNDSLIVEGPTGLRG